MLKILLANRNISMTATKLLSVGFFLGNVLLSPSVAKQSMPQKPLGVVPIVPSNGDGDLGMLIPDPNQKIPSMEAVLSSYSIFERAFTMMLLPDNRVDALEVETVLGGVKATDVKEFNRTVFTGPAGTEISLDRNLEPVFVGRGRFSTPSITLRITFPESNATRYCLNSGA